MYSLRSGFKIGQANSEVLLADNKYRISIVLGLLNTAYNRSVAELRNQTVSSIPQLT